MSVILAIETATRRGSVALVRDEDVCARKALGEREASATLLVAIDEVLRAGRIDLSGVDLFAAAIGPGSFTGLRAGLATVRALARASGRPAVGVPTLWAVAYAEGGPGDPVCVVLPAGRRELFCQLLRVGREAVEEMGDPVYLTPSALLERESWPEGLVWAGEGARALRQELAQAAAERGLRWREGRIGETGAWTLAEGVPELASAVARLARVGVALRPLYVRPADAELKWGR